MASQPNSIGPRQGCRTCLGTGAWTDALFKLLAGLLINLFDAGHGQGDREAIGDRFVDGLPYMGLTLDNKIGKHRLAQHGSTNAFPAARKHCSTCCLIFIRLPLCWVDTQSAKVIWLQDTQANGPISLASR